MQVRLSWPFLPPCACRALSVAKLALLAELLFVLTCCRNRKGKHRRGRKVTGLEFTPMGNHLLVTTNDSRVRLYR